MQGGSLMNLGFEKIKVYYDGDEESSNYGKVIMEPLERGFARTYGNTLRRILISSMPGTSVIGIKMPNVYHEYASIPGSVTDMTELILNLKQVRFKSDGDELKTVRFEANKEGNYTAASLDLPTGVELQNPDQELIQLTGDMTVEFDLYLKQSRGYVDAEKLEEFSDRPDIIKVDGMFTPIKKVGYEEQNMRIGQNANYERLILDVLTDGSITSKEAVMLAGKIAQSHFNFFDNMSDIAEKTEIFQEKKEEEDRIMDLPIEHLDLSVRAYNCLKRDGYTTVRAIYALSEQGVDAIHQMGEKSVREVIDKMKELGLELRKD
jgi:DNA-directed RNA polymerase subunit alpha